MIEKDDLKDPEYQEDEGMQSNEDLNDLNGKSSNTKRKKSANKNKSDKLTDECDALRTELAETKDKFIRLFSEFDNYRKRTAKERMDLIASASEGVISRLLPVLDDIDRAKDAYENTTDVDALKQGTDLIFDKFKGILNTCGLKEMESTGEDFNPDIHEAVANFPVEDKDQKNKIIETAEKGYILNDKVIRIAKVVVGN